MKPRAEAYISKKVQRAESASSHKRECAPLCLSLRHSLVVVCAFFQLIRGQKQSCLNNKEPFSPYVYPNDLSSAKAAALTIPSIVVCGRSACVCERAIYWLAAVAAAVIVTSARSLTQLYTPSSSAHTPWVQTAPCFFLICSRPPHAASIAASDNK